MKIFKIEDGDNDGAVFAKSVMAFCIITLYSWVIIGVGFVVYQIFMA